MFDYTHYVPILKGKEGEYGALKELSSTVKDRITPLVEVTPIPWDFENEVPAKTIDAHLGKVTDKIKGCWPEKTPIFIDLLWIPETERMSDGRHPLTFILDSARSKDLYLIPVTGVARNRDYQMAVKDAALKDRRGYCLRLENDDFGEFGTLGTKINDLLGEIGTGPDEVDLLLDFKEISSSQTAAVSIAANSLISTLPFIAQWRTLIFAGTGFPPDLSDVAASSVKTIARSEWTVWQSLVSTSSTIKRKPSLGDYGISHPSAIEIDPRIMKMSANLRYTTDTDWLILKGRNVRDHGFDQFHALCRQLIARPEYKGAAFSWGDQSISDCAARTTNPGNATTWRKVGTNHHVTLVAGQLASLSVP